MRRFYPLPADERSLWPHANDILNTPGAYHLGFESIRGGQNEYRHRLRSTFVSVLRLLNAVEMGRRVLDSGLAVTWGNDSRYWSQIDDSTSPRGRAWRLRNVCWLAVNGKASAPRPGLYAAFFRVRQALRKPPLLRFSAEWKASAKPASDVGFLPRGSRGRDRAASVRQECEAETSWTHSRSYDEDNAGGWLLCHVGNIVVSEPVDQQRRRSRDGGGADEEAGRGRVGETDTETEVLVSFGGENDWCGNLDVDFAAIAPIRLSWDVERVLMIGHRKGHSGAEAAVSASGVQARQHRGETEPLDGDCYHGGVPATAASSATDTASYEEGSASPLSWLPEGVLLLVLEFSQPTLVRPRAESARQGHGDNADAEGNGGNSSSDSGAWEVF